MSDEFYTTFMETTAKAKQDEEACKWAVMENVRKVVKESITRDGSTVWVFKRFQ